jgi:hypothetical protein
LADGALVRGPQDHPAGGESAYRPRGAAARWVLPGLYAGTLFLLLEILIGAFTTTPWAFPEGVAEVVRIGRPTYDLQPVPLMTGLVVHLTVSVGLGALFTGIAGRLRLRGGRLIIGSWLFSGTETAVVIWGVLHPLFPTTVHYLLNAIPLAASIAGHNLFGLSLGLILSREHRRPVPRDDRHRAAAWRLVPGRPHQEPGHDDHGTPAGFRDRA